MSRRSREVPAPPPRLSQELRRRIEEWAARQGDKPTRSEAIRRLIERGLAPGRGQAEGRAVMSYAQLLSALQKLTATDLERPARVLVCNQALAICAVVDEDDGPPLLDTGVVMVEVAGGCE